MEAKPSNKETLDSRNGLKPFDGSIENSDSSTNNKRSNESIPLQTQSLMCASHPICPAIHVRKETFQEEEAKERTRNGNDPMEQNKTGNEACSCKPALFHPSSSSSFDDRRRRRRDKMERCHRCDSPASFLTTIHALSKTGGCLQLERLDVASFQKEAIPFNALTPSNLGFYWQASQTNAWALASNRLRRLGIEQSEKPCVQCFPRSFSIVLSYTKSIHKKCTHPEAFDERSQLFRLLTSPCPACAFCSSAFLLQPGSCVEPIAACQTMDGIFRPWRLSKEPMKRARDLVGAATLACVSACYQVSCERQNAMAVVQCKGMVECRALSIRMIDALLVKTERTAIETLSILERMAPCAANHHETIGSIVAGIERACKAKLNAVSDPLMTFKGGRTMSWRPAVLDVHAAIDMASETIRVTRRKTLGWWRTAFHTKESALPNEIKKLNPRPTLQRIASFGERAVLIGSSVSSGMVSGLQIQESLDVLLPVMAWCQGKRVDGLDQDFVLAYTSVGQGIIVKNKEAALQLRLAAYTLDRCFFFGRHETARPGSLDPSEHEEGMAALSPLSWEKAPCAPVIAASILRARATGCESTKRCVASMLANLVAPQVTQRIRCMNATERFCCFSPLLSRSVLDQHNVERRLPEGASRSEACSPLTFVDFDAEVVLSAFECIARFDAFDDFFALPFVGSCLKSSSIKSPGAQTPPSNQPSKHPEGGLDDIEALWYGRKPSSSAHWQTEPLADGQEQQQSDASDRFFQTLSDGDQEEAFGKGFISPEHAHLMLCSALFANEMHRFANGSAKRLALAFEKAPFCWRLLCPRLYKFLKMCLGSEDDPPAPSSIKDSVSVPGGKASLAICREIYCCLLPALSSSGRSGNWLTQPKTNHRVELGMIGFDQGLPAELFIDVVCNFGLFHSEDFCHTPPWRRTMEKKKKKPSSMKRQPFDEKTLNQNDPFMSPSSNNNNNDDYLKTLFKIKRSIRSSVLYDKKRNAFSPLPSKPNVWCDCLLSDDDDDEEDKGSKTLLQNDPHKKDKSSGGRRCAHRKRNLPLKKKKDPSCGRLLHHYSMGIQESLRHSHLWSASIMNQKEEKHVYNSSATFMRMMALISRYETGLSPYDKPLPLPFECAALDFLSRLEKATCSVQAFPPVQQQARWSKCVDRMIGETTVIQVCHHGGLVFNDLFFVPHKRALFLNVFRDAPNALMGDLIAQLFSSYYPPCVLLPSNPITAVSDLETVSFHSSALNKTTDSLALAAASEPTNKTLKENTAFNDLIPCEGSPSTSSSSSSLQTALHVQESKTDEKQDQLVQDDQTKEDAIMETFITMQEPDLLFDRIHSGIKRPFIPLIEPYEPKKKRRLAKHRHGKERDAVLAFCKRIQSKKQNRAHQLIRQCQKTWNTIDEPK